MATADYYQKKHFIKTKNIWVLSSRQNTNKVIFMKKVIYTLLIVFAVTVFTGCKRNYTVYERRVAALHREDLLEYRDLMRAEGVEAHF